MKDNWRLIIKGFLIILFLYVAFFSIQNFWQGYHDLDLSANFMNLGYIGDTGTDNKIFPLGETYLRGLNQMKISFIWLGLDCLLAVLVGYIYRR